MSLFVPMMGGGRFNFRVNNWGADPVGPPFGTALTPGTSNGEGTYADVLSAAAVTSDIRLLHVHVQNGNTAGQIKDHLLDIGYDPAGGTSYTDLITNIVCGAASGGAALGALGHVFWFPIRIPAGSSVAARVQGSNATAGTVTVAVTAWGKPSSPESCRSGMYTETLGTITNSGGVSFTPGNSTTGAWVSLGTTAKPLWYWNIGYQVSNATITNELTWVEIAYGDGSNKHTICTKYHLGGTTETVGLGTDTALFEGYCPVPAGAELWIRGHCNNAPDTGYNGVAIGIGGG